MSGAIVADNGDGTVTKSGGIPERTRAQGQWIIDHGGDAFPKITELLDDGYVMEHLEYVDYWDVRPEFTVPTLQKYVWSQDPVVPPTTHTRELLEAKMKHTMQKHLADYIDDSTRRDILAAAAIAGDGAYSTRHCLTHGDPTAENVMARRSGELLFIDPIGATEVVPDAAVVDIGKMLQSACGWEDAKYNSGVIAYRRADVETYVNDSTLFEIGESWAVMHVMRAIPYVIRNIPDSLPRVLNVLYRAIDRW